MIAKATGVKGQRTWLPNNFTTIFTWKTPLRESNYTFIKIKYKQWHVGHFHGMLAIAICSSGRKTLLFIFFGSNLSKNSFVIKMIRYL